MSRDAAELILPSDTDCTKIGTVLHAKIPTESPTSFTIASVGAHERSESPDRYSIIRENKRPSMCLYREIRLSAVLYLQRRNC